MSTTKLLGVALLVVGLVLLFFGWQSSQSVVDQVSETLTGRFTDSTLWYIVAGAASFVVGAVLLASGRR